jgi:lactoylglutathione lyase
LQNVHLDPALVTHIVTIVGDDAAERRYTTMLTKMTPNLMVEDVNETIEFYRGMLGFEVLATVPEQGALDWALAKRDDIQLMFQSRTSLTGDLPALDGKEIGGTLSLYTEVTDVDDLYHRLHGKVDIVQDLHTTFYHTKEFTFRDCNGYFVAFSQAL